MFGLSREIDFAIRLGLVDEIDGKELMESLEKQLTVLHEASIKEA